MLFADSTLRSARVASVKSAQKKAALQGGFFTKNELKNAENESIIMIDKKLTLKQKRRRGKNALYH